jgi:hypothetical protein
MEVKAYLRDFFGKRGIENIEWYRNMQACGLSILKGTRGFESIKLFNALINDILSKSRNSIMENQPNCTCLITNNILIIEIQTETEKVVINIFINNHHEINFTFKSNLTNSAVATEVFNVHNLMGATAKLTDLFRFETFQVNLQYGDKNYRHTFQTKDLNAELATPLEIEFFRNPSCFRSSAEIPTPFVLEIEDINILNERVKYSTEESCDPISASQCSNEEIENHTAYKLRRDKEAKKQVAVNKH